MPIIANMVNTLNSIRLTRYAQLLSSTPRRRIPPSRSGVADGQRGLFPAQRRLCPLQKRFDGIAGHRAGVPDQNLRRQFLPPPSNGGAGRHLHNAVADGLQRGLAAAAQDHQKSTLTPVAYKVCGPNRVSQSSTQRLQNGLTSLLPVPGPELAEFMSFEANDAKGNLTVRKSAQGGMQVRKHHRLSR